MTTILVVDDDSGYRENILEILEFENYETLEAENGLVGLHLIRQHSPNLVVCDVDMPEMNGIEVLRTIKTHPVYAKIPFIVTTGRTDELTKYTAYKLGAAAYLIKPIASPELLSTVDHFLKESHRVLLL